jgi:hypothetical protein
LEARLNRIYRFVLKWWNTILAATSLAGVAVFSFIPPIQKYTSVFVFLAANAIVWTLIEIKTQLSRRERAEVVYSSMRAARPYIILDIENRLRRSSPNAPLNLIFLGGRIRSMSDIVRELADDLKKEKIHGHLSIQLFCLDPDYISGRTLPGEVKAEKQASRNRSYGNLINGISSELTSLAGKFSDRSSIVVRVLHYKEDPHIYAYLIGNDIIYWGAYTWSPVTSDFVGPENPCLTINAADPEFLPMRDWIVSRTELYRHEVR